MKLPLIVLSLVLSNALFAQEIKKENDSIKKKGIALEEVTVVNQKKFITVESDKTTVGVKDNPLLSTGNAYEAVKKLPGVIAAPTGGLSLNGKGVAIFIDGAPSTLSASDLESYLSSLPANAIEKVELIYNPGAAFDANANGSIINLVTSSRKLKGVNASVNINYNFNKYQKPSPQILLNGKEKNLSWQTMLGFNYIESENESINGQNFTSFTPIKFLKQEKLTVSTDRNVYFRGGTNYKLSGKSNLLFNYNATLNNNWDEFNAKTSGSGISDYINSGITKSKGNNQEISLQFKTKLDTLGKTLDVIAFTNVFSRNPNMKSNAVENTISSFNTVANEFSLLNYYAKYDFVIPFKKAKFSLNTGGKLNTLKVNNTGSYNFNSPTTAIIDFDYKETNLAFYAEARKKINKLNVTLGLRFEDFNVNRIGIKNEIATKIEFKNTNLFPNISLLYELNSSINASASYSRKISQPNYGLLDPNGSNFDQYNASEGNLLLDPSFYDNFDFKITAMQFIQIGANYTVAKNKSLFILTAEPGELVSTQTFQQFDRYKTFSAFANFPIPLDYFFKGKEEFSKRMNTIDKMNYIFLSINYIQNLTDGYTFSFQPKPIWNYAAQAQILLPWDIKNSMSYFILPSGIWEIYKITKPIQQFDISFNKDFMNKKLKIGVHVFDVFNSNEINALVSSTNLQTNFHEKNDSRTFRISLTYNFGNLKLENENTEIQTEKVKSGGGLVK